MNYDTITAVDFLRHLLENRKKSLEKFCKSNRKIKNSTIEMRTHQIECSKRLLRRVMELQNEGVLF